ncbi:MAG: hypothetical protein ACFB16_11355 [Phormidesmis sp.]
MRRERRAIAPIKRALTLAEPEHHICLFAEAGAPIQRLLQEATTRQITQPTPTNY